jgi:putative membrane protein
MKANERSRDPLLKWIWVISVAIPVVVAILLFLPTKLSIEAGWVYMLPHINAVINSLTALFLIIAVIMVKTGRIELHKKLMMAAFILGALFLVSYVVYHASADSVIYGDVNKDGILSDEERSAVASSRGFYLSILLSHILLAIVVVPFVLLAFYYALSNQVERHKKIVKFTFPIWLYVSVTGVMVYYMISTFY